MRGTMSERPAPVDSAPLVERHPGRLALLTRSHPLADLASDRANNFNLLRFLAASLVIFSHCYALGYGEAPEPVMRYLGALETGGSLGVVVFFAISGFLVTRSFVERGGRLWSFVGARAARIYPGLIAATVFSIGVASLATTLPIGTFLTAPPTLRFLLHDATAWRMQFELPGAFTANPFPNVVNGSLWTLPLEIQMYATCTALGLAGLYASRTAFNACFAVLLIVAALSRGRALPLVSQHPDAPRLAIVFLFGAFFFLNRDRVPVSLPVAIAVLAAIVALHRLPYFRFVYLPALAYLTLVLAYHPTLYVRPFTRLGDYSYGLYIYAFPVQQLIAARAVGIRPVPLFLWAFPVVLAAAAVSWHWIEEPALRRKPR